MPEANPLNWLDLLKRLKEADVEFVVIGGVAAALHGSPLSTYDLDVCALMNEENLHKIHRALISLHPCFRMRPDRLPLPEDPVKLRGINNLYLVTDLGVIDILDQIAGVGDYSRLNSLSVEMNFGSFRCRVIDLNALVASKKALARPKDLIGLQYLEEIQRMNESQNIEKSPADEAGDPSTE